VYLSSNLIYFSLFSIFNFFFKKKPSKPIGSSHNTSAKPFGQAGNYALVNKQYNSPINLFSNKNIAETIKAHSELLAPGVVGINFMKQDAPINKESDVYKAILEEEATKNQKRSGQFGNQYGIPQNQSPAPQSVTPQQQQSQADLNPSYRLDDLPRTSPTLQSQSFKRLQQIVGDDDPAPTRHVEAPVANPNAGLPSNQTIESNICSECGRLIVGIFCKIKDKKLHEDCFRCSTCGCSLKNLGYYNINEKLYCEIHAAQAAQATHSPNRIITPNSTTIRQKDSKPTSPAFQIPIKPTASTFAPQVPAKPLSPSISTPSAAYDINANLSNAQSSNYSTNVAKNFNSSLYQSVPHPYPGANNYTSKQTTTSISAPKFSWPNKGGQSMQTTEKITTTYSTGPGNTISNTITTNYSSNTYKDSAQLPNISNNFDALKINDWFAKSKIPPTTLPKPNLNSWQQQNQTGLNKTITSTSSFKQQQQQSTIPAPGQSSFTGSIPAPRRGRGQLRAAELGSSRIPICANLGCCQQIRGPFISALGKCWCPEHFICSNPACKRSLQDCGFVEEKNTLYCENCFENHFAPTCFKCHQRIKGDCLLAINKQYHPECFVCTHCKKVFANTSFYLEDGLPYCERDWNELFTTKCVACNHPIEAGDRWVEALNNSFHSQCFKCTMCGRTLEGQSFYAKGGRPYCKNH